MLTLAVQGYKLFSFGSIVAPIMILFFYKRAPIRILGADHRLLEAVLADTITYHRVYLKPCTYCVALFVYLFRICNNHLLIFII